MANTGDGVMTAAKLSQPTLIREPRRRLAQDCSIPTDPKQFQQRTGDSRQATHLRLDLRIAAQL